MASNVYVLGAYSTAFQPWPDSRFEDLVREAYIGALRDAGMDNGLDLSAAWFGNCLMSYWGQAMTRGSVSFIPLVHEGLFPDRAPIFNVEGACATGSIALAGAIKEIRAGDADLTLAIGVEKLYDREQPPSLPAEIAGGFDCTDPLDLIENHQRLGESVGMPFGLSIGRLMAIDTYAIQANYHMKKFKTTAEQIAIGAAKNYSNGALNPKAQYRLGMSPESVLADRIVSAPLTRAMCAPIGDGAAAAIVCSERYLRTVSASVKDRAIKIRALAITGGEYRLPGELSLTRAAADRAYAVAGLCPSDVDVAEIHDATSFSEIYQCEMMRFCRIGEGGQFVGSGATKIGGTLPVNTSGGLVSKGDPTGATGLSMCYELVTQLRGEAGKRQVQNAVIGLHQNGGGLIGMGEVLAAVTIYERSR